MKHVRVLANIEIDLEVIFNNILKEYECENVDEIQMDYVVEYIDNHITYLEGRRVDWISSCEGLCGSIDGFEERDYKEIEEELDKFKERNK